MNILGIIAEFNPLHTGHEYLIRHLRRETGADFCVIVMSGDYVQRGEPAFFQKSLRTWAALLSGADLVLELPLSVSTGSAEYFAQGAVSLLDRLGCVTHLGFGSENGDIRNFQLTGKLLSEEPEDYRRFLQNNLKAGMNFPKARYEALSAYLAEHTTQYSSDACRPALSQDASTPVKQISVSGNIPEILSLLSAPNNILGTEYCKALHRLHSSMIPVTVKRLGAGYHEKIDSVQTNPSHQDHSGPESSQPAGNSSDVKSLLQAEDFSAAEYASASGLRHAFLHAPVSRNTETLLQNFVPQHCHFLYKNALLHKQYVTFDDFFLPLYYTLQYTDAETLSRFQDVTPEFSGRLLRTFRKCSSVAELCAALKSKNYTSTRINRSLLHILLHLTGENAAAEKEQGYAFYARILGFRRESVPLLTLIRQLASIPLVSKLADTSNYLSPSAAFQLEQTIKASELYRTAMPGVKSGSEYAQNIVIL